MNPDNEFVRVAIIGAGMAGLTFARILQLHGQDSVIFEGDASRDSRPQGGTLDMHEESGQQALRDAGLHEAFLRVARPEGQCMRIADKTGKLHWDEPEAPPSMDRPEIDRGVLRDLLIDSLDPNRIRWNHKVVSIESAPNDCHLVRFQNGTAITAGVLIGADGAWSRVRPLLTAAQPSYTGVSFVEIGIPDAAQPQPELAAMVGPGSYLALSDGKGLLAQRNGDGRIRVYVAFRSPQDSPELTSIPFDRPAEARQALLNQFSDWAPSLTSLIHACDDSFLLRPINMLPIGLTWESKPGVTLIGDSAHLMSPFAGEGANLAMLDAAEMAKELLATREPGEAIKAYDNKMFVRAKQAAEESARNLDLCFAPEGAANLASQMALYEGQP